MDLLEISKYYKEYKGQPLTLTEKSNSKVVYILIIIIKPRLYWQINLLQYSFVLIALFLKTQFYLYMYYNLHNYN